MAAVLDAFASKLTNILVGMAKEEVEMLLGVPGEITKLETTLGDLSSILADAERRRIRDTAAEGWVRDLKDVMYDADDILDLCKIMEGGEDPSSSTSRCWNIPKMFFCFRNPVVAHEIGKKIQALNQRLEDLQKRSTGFGFITQAINSSGYINNASNSLSDKTSSLIVQSNVVGDKIKEDTKKIVDLLIKKVDSHAESKSNNVVVAVAITGMGGIGKTTLARMVFNDSTVEQNFEDRIWLSVNKEVNEISVLQNVLASLGANHEGFSGNKDLLERALKDTVRQKKKFLLVLDDVWGEKVWNDFLSVPLSFSAHGSRVLVTTRNDEVARGMNAKHLHRVDKLQTEDAWVLLKKQVVLNESDDADVDGLKGIGIKIVENCDCLPLAVKVLGGVLRRKTRIKDTWMDICNNHTWSAEGIDGDINRAVYLSYEDLPSHLKQCFVYCSLFPKDELIRGGATIGLWIAQGYIQDKMSSKAPEDVGEEYCSELISRNLLEPDKTLYSHTACIMHDVVRHCAQYIIKDEGALISEAQDVKTIPKLRHLSITNKAVGTDDLQQADSVRTLMLFGSTTVELGDILNHLSCLRVLHLNDVTLDELPNSIWHLKHLRYLCLSNTSISTIPRDIGDLKFLQALDLAGCTNVSELPNSITKLQKLRSLNIADTGITSVPRGFGKLEDLVYMWGFPTHSNDSADGWCSLEELGALSKLKRLQIRGLEKAPSGSMAAKAMLSNKHHLIDLDLIFTSRLGENGEAKDDMSEEEHKRTEDVLANLCPPTCIEMLDIIGYFARGLPQWMRTMSAFGSLRRLALDDYAYCTQLPNGLGQLPFLDYFWIKRAPSVQFIGHELLSSLGDDNDGKDGASVTTSVWNIMKQPHHISPGSAVAFPKLRKLGFVGMLEWTEWEWEQHVAAMPALKDLVVQNCKLQRLPPGLSYHALGLRELQLTNMTYLVSIENFPSLVKLWSYNNPRIERISNNPSLQWIDISKCPALKELNGLPSLQSLEWWDLGAEALPQYLQETKLNKLRVDCSPSMLKLIASQADSSEWEKIKHVHQLKAYGKTSPEDKVDRHIYYIKEPYSFEVDLGESID